MDTARGVQLWTGRRKSMRSLENWLLCWVLLPNLSFSLAWLIGSPPRQWPVLVTAVIGIAVHRAPFVIKVCAFAIAMVYSVLEYIGGIFNLSLWSLTYSLRFAGELSPSASPEYAVGAASLAATFVVAWFSLRRSSPLERPIWIVAAASVALIFALIDAQMVSGNRGTYKRVPEPSAAFESAVTDAGLLRLADGKRHLMIVMVESMGLPVDPTLRERLTASFTPAEVRARYLVSTGDTLFYGSTTTGEMRELCGRWDDYPSILATRDEACLPARLVARGYRTQAWHSFDGSFFDRNRWYPNAGFQAARFSDQILGAGAERCSGVFAGACDRDVPAQMAGLLKTAREPQFLYWLTVNTHLPVAADAHLKTDGCDRFNERLNRAVPMACRLLFLVDQTALALSREIAAPDFPPTDILIVGDHMPPFFDRKHREVFAGDRVPWILLRAKPRS